MSDQSEEYIQLSLVEHREVRIVKTVSLKVSQLADKMPICADVPVEVVKNHVLKNVDWIRDRMGVTDLFEGVKPSEFVSAPKDTEHKCKAPGYDANNGGWEHQGDPKLLDLDDWTPL